MVHGGLVLLLPYRDRYYKRASRWLLVASIVAALKVVSIANYSFRFADQGDRWLGVAVLALLTYRRKGITPPLALRLVGGLALLQGIDLLWGIEIQAHWTAYIRVVLWIAFGALAFAAARVEAANGCGSHPERKGVVAL